MEITSFPMIAGASMLFGDKTDVRREICLVLIGMICLLAGLEAFGFIVGDIGKAIVPMALTMIGYYFGKKESEAC